MEFAELLESLKAADASVDTLLKDVKGDRKASKNRDRNDPKYLKDLAEVANFTADVFEGRRPTYHLQEAMSRSDFPLLFGDLIDRQMIGTYREYPVSWAGYVRTGTVRDFRTVKRRYVDGGDSGTTKVDELTEYPETAMTEGEYALSIAKYGMRIGFSFETFVNDDMDALRDAPNRLARGARRTEDRFVTDLFVGPSGPDAALYTAPNGNIVTGNPALSLTGLQTAMTSLSSAKDAAGNPIFLDMVTLVVPPALEITARNILNATELRISGVAAGISEGVQATVSNWMRNRLALSVNPYIPILATSANGNTSWFLFAADSNPRTALEVARLRGYETPQLFQKAPNALRMGGGPADPMDGSYEIDAVEWKVRHFLGGAIQDPKMTVASNGTGS